LELAVSANDQQGRARVFIDSGRLSQLRGELEKALSARQVSVDPEQIENYSKDESNAGEFPPDLVVFPETTAQVSSIFRTCQRLGVPVTPCGARSGKSGGSLPVHRGVAMSLERMNQIKTISREDLIAIVEPGVITGELMKAVEAQGLFYPPDPNSLEFCTLGGNVAENAGGPRALKYGVTRDYVIGLEWVLPSGEVLKVGRRTIKGVAGYDLVGLFVGSEGTLGVATEITLQLIPLPRQVRTSLVLFRSVLDAATAISAVLAAGILPRTLELLDDVAIRAVEKQVPLFPPGTGAALIAEIDGNQEEAVLSELATLGEVCAAKGAIETLVAQDHSQREKLWAARRVLSNSLKSLKRWKISEDIAVPRSRMVEVISTLKALGETMGLTIATYGHAGDGNLHANILYDRSDQQPAVQEAIERMLRLTVEVGGTITGEHGIGLSKRDFLPWEQSEKLIDLQKRLKDFFDPSGLLNPGKIFRPSTGE
jgi:glycolate oxidase